MNDTRSQDSSDNDQVEIVDLPAQEGSPASYQTPIMRLQERARIPALLWGIRIGIVVLVILLVFIIAAQTPLFSSSQSNRPQSPPAPLTIIGMSVLNGFVYVNASDGSIAAYRSSDGERAWRVSLGTTVYYAIASDQTIYCFLTKGDYGVVEAFRASDGALLWTHQDAFTGLVWMMTTGGIVYLNTERGVIYAMRGSDGHVLWQFTAGMPMQLNGFMTVSNGIAAIQTSGNLLYLLRTSDGKIIYHYSSFITLQNTIFPSVEDGLISIVSNDGSVQVRSASDGALLWSYHPVNGAGAWLPTILGGIVYVNDGGSIRALRVQDGALLWQFKPKAATSPPIFDNGAIYLTSADGSVVALRAADGKQLWNTTLPNAAVNVAFLPVIDNNIVYVNLNQSGGAVYALRAGDGSLIWQHALYAGTSEYPPVVSDGIIYLGKDDHSIDAWQGSDGRFLWHYSASSKILWYPAVLDGIMYVRPFNGTLDVLRVSDGMSLWHYPSHQ